MWVIRKWLVYPAIGYRIGVLRHFADKLFSIPWWNEVLLGIKVCTSYKQDDTKS